ncbi:zinc finger protein 660-like [Pectinophora gossypiella]|uniref:C2H2-type domain-containing protein n=1 Tax=Pectinophora gossypiella TaxID=13191 RepID=A0A1E1WSR9_PECGO|nr:zinc finger protein 660-like [Pectinophora gossypiella]
MPPKRKKEIKNQGSKKKKAKTNNAKSISPQEVKKENSDIPTNSNHLLVPPMVEGRNYTLTLVDVVSKKKIIHCKECTKKFRFKRSYLKHRHVEHCKLPTSVACSLCPVRCPDNATLKQHIASVHERATYQCDHCNKQFVRHAHVIRHKAQSGCDGLGANWFSCQICHANFSRKDNLLVHLRLQHILRKKFACKQCSYSTSTFSKLILHVQHYHSGLPRKYECDHCGKVTSSRAAICKHLEIHGDKKYACDVCGYSTYTIEVMRRHVLTHVVEKPYKCKECGASFIQRVQLLKHELKHIGNTCQICSQTFGSKLQLATHVKKQHLRSDNRKKLVCPFENCPTTEKEFSNEELKIHVKMHLEDKPHSCEVCGKKFRNERDMRRHVTSHTLERARRCMYCVSVARAYVRGEQLVRHVRKTHPTVFNDHLAHVRRVLGTNVMVERVKKSELEAILNVLDAETDRILQGYGEGVLYGGMQEADPLELSVPSPNALMSEEELAENLSKLLEQLIDKELLQCFGWPDQTVDALLEKVIENCGAKPADPNKWTRVQCLRENAKHLFIYVIEDKNIARMLDTHTIDQIVKHILTQVSEDNGEEKVVEIQMKGT